MSADTETPSASVPVPVPTLLYILTWRLPSRGRGRKHMALFIPDDDYISTPPRASLPGVEDGTDEASCKGTLLQAVGSPFSGYMHSFVREFEARGVREIESTVRVGEVTLAPASAPGVGADRGKTVGQMLEQYASRVRAPGVAKRPWVAEDIRNCQDWLLDLTAYLVQRRVVGTEVLEAVKAQMEKPVAVMPAPSGVRATGSGKPEAKPVTASLGPFASMSVSLRDQYAASSSKDDGDTREAEQGSKE